jgi:hypothetical protein
MTGYQSAQTNLDDTRRKILESEQKLREVQQAIVSMSMSQLRIGGAAQALISLQVEKLKATEEQYIHELVALRLRAQAAERYGSDKGSD